MKTALVVAVLTGCAKQTARVTHASEPAAPATWTTEDGRDDARIEMVRMVIDTGNTEGALRLIAAFRSDGFSSPALDALHGRALRLAGLVEDARLMLEGVPRSSASYGEARNELGILALDQGEHDRAIAAFKAATQADRSKAEYWNNLGFALFGAGRTEEAVEALRRSLALDSAQSRTRNNLGFALIAAGRADEAWRVLRAGSTEADARYNLGLGLELRGDAEAAVSAYRKALEADPSHPGARDALERLAPSASQHPPSSPLPTPSI